MLKRIGAEEGGEFKAVASGTLPSGRPVIVNADGTVSVISSTSASESVGTAAIYETGATAWPACSYDTVENKTLIVWSDQSSSHEGQAAVATISGTSITFGSVVTWASGNRPNYMDAVYDVASGKHVIVYSDRLNSNYGTAVVATVSGTSVSFGTPVVYESAATNYTEIAYDTANEKVVIAYEDDANSDYGTAIVGTVSGTSISFGSAAVFNSGATQYPSIAYDANAGKFVIAYQDQGDSAKGNAVVGTVSGTSISFGSEATFNTGVVGHVSIGYDSSAQKTLVIYQDATDSDQGKGQVGTISGTSISFGSAVVFNNSQTTYNNLIYHPLAEKMIINYTDNVGGDHRKVVEGTISGTSVTFSTEVTILADQTIYGKSVYDSSSKVILIAYRATSQDRGYASVFQAAYTETNLTSENYIGMSRGVVTGEAGSTGTAVSFESGSTQLPKVVFDSNSNRIVIAYLDGGNSDKGTAVVGTVSGTSISFGSVVIYEQGGTANIDAVFDSSNNKVVIAYQDNGDSGRGKAIVGTVDSSDNSISFGSATQFNSGANNAYNVSAAFDSSNNKVVVAYRDNGNSDYGTAVVGTVSGTSISFGTPVVFESANSSQTAVAFDSSNNKVVIAYKDEGNSSYGTAIVGTVSGTSISFGSAAVFNAGETSQIFSTFDTSNNKVVIAYRDNGNSDQGTAIVGTVSGTSISFGSEVVFNDTGNTQGIGITFDSNANKIVISYEDRGNSDKGEFVTGTVSGTSISFGTPEVFSGSNAVFHTDCGFDSNANKVVIAYANDTDSSDRGEAIVTNIDSISRGEVADGGNASMDIIGSVSDNQVSLTAGQQYFVQNDGTISTTADSPSVLAGTAISATELVVKT